MLDPVAANGSSSIFTGHDVLEGTTAALDDRGRGGVTFVTDKEHLVQTEGPRYPDGLAQDFGRVAPSSEGGAHGVADVATPLG